MSTIEVPLLIFIILVQVIVVLLLLALFFYGRSPKKAKKTLEDKKKSATADLLEIPEEFHSNDAATPSAASVTVNLGPFREHYDALKEKFTTLSNTLTQLMEQIKILLSEEDQTNLQATLDQLQEQKDALQTSLDEAETELNNLDSGDANSGTDPQVLVELNNESSMAAAKRLNQKIESVSDIVNTQSTSLEGLQEQVKELELDAEQTAPITDNINGLQEQNKQLGETVSSLEEENKLLSDQIQALLLQGQEGDDNSDAAVQEVKDALAKKEQEYTDLQKQFTDMESEYKKLLEENEK